MPNIVNSFPTDTAFNDALAHRFACRALNKYKSVNKKYLVQQTGFLFLSKHAYINTPIIAEYVQEMFTSYTKYIVHHHHHHHHNDVQKKKKNKIKIKDINYVTTYIYTVYKHDKNDAMFAIKVVTEKCLANVNVRYRFCSVPESPQDSFRCRTCQSRDDGAICNADRNDRTCRVAW